MSNTLLKGLEDLEKQRKDKVSNPASIGNIDLEVIFKSTLAKINEVYTEGTMGFIRESYADLDGQLSTMEETIDNLWESCLKGTSRLGDFKAAMDQYSKLYLKAIDLYKNRGNTVQKELNINHQKISDFL